MTRGLCCYTNPSLASAIFCVARVRVCVIHTFYSTNSQRVSPSYHLYIYIYIFFFLSFFFVFFALVLFPFSPRTFPCRCS